jgi:cobalt/nickel transport protein
MEKNENGAETTPWFDPFTRWMLIIMFAILFAIFAAAKYMDMHGMQGGGTDDTVNAMASHAACVTAHPFINLPGDAQIGAFSVANFFAGMIVGHSWKKLFEKEKK